MLPSSKLRPAATLALRYTFQNTVWAPAKAIKPSCRCCSSAKPAVVAIQCTTNRKPLSQSPKRLGTTFLYRLSTVSDSTFDRGKRPFSSMATSAGRKVELEVVDIENPKEYNFILGHAHFIKTVEDIYEALVQSSTALKFGIAFNEASPGYEAMPGRKVRFDGNSEELTELAKVNAMALGAGHTFIVFLDGGFPVNCLNAVKSVTEVCRIHCATSNPTSVVLAKTSDDAVGILGVIDGVRPLDFETDDDKKKRHEFLRMIGYKR